MSKKPHFKAIITYLATQEGIKTPVSSGFRTVIRFPYDERDFIAEQNFLESEIVFPGDTANVDIILLKSEDKLEQIYKGLGFDLLINEMIIGSGSITDVYNDK